MSEQNAHAQKLVAFVHGGGCSLGKAVATELAQKGVRIVLHREAGQASAEEWLAELEAGGGEIVELPKAVADQGETGLAARACAVWGRLDILINLCVPTLDTLPKDLHDYPARLFERGLSAGRMMTGSPRSAVVNHCFLPSMYAGTNLESHMPVLKGAITGVTRQLCRQLGPQGVRVNTVQTGLLDLPETRRIASGEVLSRKPPVGRWGSAQDFAKLAGFLALRNSYMTGQAVILDGGMTAGNTGT